MLYQNKYRIESARLKGWDYTNNAWYYITICTKNKSCFFGRIAKERMCLSAVGKIVEEEWLATPKIRRDLELDEWIIMPNHIHVIIIIDNKNVETHGYASLQVKQNLSNIVRGFKSSCTTKIHQAGFKDFVWQPRFYDHIIRNEKSLHEIRHYIHYNYLKWDEDEEYAK
ncbi:MAG: transposase [Bacteroidetes bacterium]|nr:transposase [Bacteroidota bacterium]